MAAWAPLPLRFVCVCFVLFCSARESPRGLTCLQAQIEEAARRADLHDVIMSWPQGYDTLVGERGLKISGGEKQRVSIARALLKDAPIILLDEATSSVDADTERRIMASFQNLFSDRTLIIIAHRLSSVQQCDTIVVLDHGRVAQQGTHSSLMAQSDGLYHKLVTLQQQQREHHAKQ